MKRWMTHVTIVVYLSALFFGFAAHALEFATDCHPVMYFLIWDMFCGWAGYEGRMEVIGEGESGKFYELAPGPWGEFHPYGFIARQHYDPNCTNGQILAYNTLKHSVHEPMVRVFVVEEEYPKRFNIPDAAYEAYYQKPKDFHKYCHTRFVLAGDGTLMNSQPPWFSFEYQLGLRDNPRLMADVMRNRSFIASDRQVLTRGAYASGPFYEPPSAIRLSSPLAQ